MERGSHDGCTYGLPYGLTYRLTYGLTYGLLMGSLTVLGFGLGFMWCLGNGILVLVLGFSHEGFTCRQ